MATVMQITVELGSRTPIGTPVVLFLGLGGREFRLNPQSGATRPLILGESANITDAQLNDPRTPALDTAHLDIFPKYIRTESDYLVGFSTVTVNPGPHQRQFRPFFAGQSTGFLTLGDRSGRYCFLA